MKIIITQSQLHNLITENENKKISDNIRNKIKEMISDKVDGISEIEFGDGNIIISVDEEKNYLVEYMIKEKVRNILYKFFPQFKLAVDIKFLKAETGKVEFDKNSKKYTYTYTKTTPDGLEIEIEGTIRQYNSGRSDEYTVEDFDLVDDKDEEKQEYIHKYREVIEDFIIDELYKFMSN